MRKPVPVVLSIAGACRKTGAVRWGLDDFFMPQNFIGCDRDQELLLPPSLREWLPEDHLALQNREVARECRDCCRARCRMGGALAQHLGERRVA